MKIQSLSRLITNEIIVQRKALSHLNWSRCLNNVTNLESNPKSNQIDPIMVNRKFFLDESNPVNHLTRHIGMHYRMPNEIRNTIFAVHGWTDRHKLIFSAFGETAIMIRKYAIDVMEQIRNGEILNDRFQRIIFHGLTGSGKTMTLNHLIHFAHKSNYVLLHFNDILNLTRLPFEYKVSEFKKKEGRVDTPMNGTLLLQHFKAQNANLIKDLKVSKSYEWSLKEHTKEGEPLINVVNHGINRSDHSSDCYAVLIRELKLAAEQNLIKLVIAIDNVNFLYWPTDLRRPDFTYYTTLDVTITRAFRKLLASDFVSVLRIRSGRHSLISNLFCSLVFKNRKTAF